MENFGKKIHQNVKKLLTVGAFVGTAAMGFSKESGKTIEKDLVSDINTTIAHNGPESNIGVVTNVQETARQTLVNTQVEFKTAIADLQKRFAHDPVMLQKINEISDLSQKAAVFATSFMKDQMEGLDTAKVQEYITDAIDAAKSPESPMFFKENAALKDLDGQLLGSVVFQAGFNVDKNHPADDIIVSKSEIANALLNGQNDIMSRLIADNIKFIAENAGVKTPNSIDQAVNNVDNLASR
ncbi:MAG TPA: hypothetical protein PKZ56_02200 [Candidatus Paceibacterota bacterium]|nr:hypothetical protein [Candidatus Paceibacterota bacterium]